jgi:hypothetical protein
MEEKQKAGGRKISKDLELHGAIEVFLNGDPICIWKKQL